MQSITHRLQASKYQPRSPLSSFEKSGMNEPAVSLHVIVMVMIVIVDFQALVLV